MPDESLTPQQWFARIQGTQNALLRILGELIASHPDRAAVIRSVQIGIAEDPPDTDFEKQLRLGEAIGIQAALTYARVAQARAAAMAADPSKPQ